MERWPKNWVGGGDLANTKLNLMNLFRFESHWLLLTLAIIVGSATSQVTNGQETPKISALVLGVAQDAGYPQAGCRKACCRPAWSDASVQRFPTSMAIVDKTNQKRYLLDCTWQLPFQWTMLENCLPREDSPGIDGVFLTHGHIGHYTGLMHLGREVMGAQNVPVYAMPRMTTLIRENGPWSLLVKLGNIDLRPLKDNVTIELTESLSVTPIEVPHRGEFSETVGFVVRTPQRSMLYLPDIDKWSRWETKIETVLKTVDFAFVDATFFRNGEIPGRDMSEIPHPFVEESLKRFQPLSAKLRNRIYFIHLNHTNPGLDPESAAARQIRQAGMHLAIQGQELRLSGPPPDSNPSPAAKNSRESNPK